MSLNVGDRVKLNEKGFSKWIEGVSNPRGIEGRVVGVDFNSDCLPVQVIWDNDKENSYNTWDLDLIGKVKPLHSRFSGSDGWKQGDIVVCTSVDFGFEDLYRKGFEYTLDHSLSPRPSACTGYSAEFKLVTPKEEEPKVEYEDKWHLNDGTVEVPEDADLLEKDGSVVAFRKVKEPLVQVSEDIIGINQEGVCSWYVSCNKIKLKATLTDGVLTDVEATIV